ncbi:MAG TPA: hypothetical protein VFZ73_05520 [Gemmatimonadaceae bacterium]
MGDIRADALATRAPFQIDALQYPVHAAIGDSAMAVSEGERALVYFSCGAGSRNSTGYSAAAGSRYVISVFWHGCVLRFVPEPCLPDLSLLHPCRRGSCLTRRTIAPHRERFRTLTRASTGNG